MAAALSHKEQYAKCKRQLVKAIENGDNIVLYGLPASGKSFLEREVKSALKEKNYFIWSPSRGDSRHQWNGFVEWHKMQSGSNKWLVHTTDKEVVFDALCDHSFTLINMAEFRHPRFTTLRSGRHYERSA